MTAVTWLVEGAWCVVGHNGDQRHGFIRTINGPLVVVEVDGEAVIRHRWRVRCR